MIKAEIVTNLGAKHEITLGDDLGFKDLAEAHEFIVKTLHDDGIFSNNVTEEFIEINCEENYQYIKLWREHDNPLLLMGQPNPAYAMDDTNPWEFAAGVNILGRMTTIKGLATERNGTTFYMPLTVNGRDGKGDTPALATMEIDTLRAAFGAYLAGTGTRCESLITPFTLLSSESASYLLDFAAQKEPDPVRPGEVTARAAGSVLE
jgi:hypothetical protein